MSSPTITGNRPNAVGDIPTFAITYTAPPDAPTAVPTTVTVTPLKPDGTQMADEQASGSGLAWTYTAGAPIDQSGTWHWRIAAAGMLNDVTEMAVVIPGTAFT